MKTRLILTAVAALVVVTGCHKSPTAPDGVSTPVGSAPSGPPLTMDISVPTAQSMRVVLSSDENNLRHALEIIVEDASKIDPTTWGGSILQLKMYDGNSSLMYSTVKLFNNQVVDDTAIFHSVLFTGHTARFALYYQPFIPVGATPVRYKVNLRKARIRFLGQVCAILEQRNDGEDQIQCNF